MKRRYRRVEDGVPRCSPITGSATAALLLFVALPVKANGGDQLPKVRVESVRRMFHNGKHNAFTNLCRFQGRYYSSHGKDGHGKSITAIYLARLQIDASTKSKNAGRKEAAKSKPATLSVMSWNIRYDNPRDGANAWKHRRDWVAQIIKREDADVVGLQEVLRRQFDDLKKRLPAMVAYGVGRDDGKTRGEFAPILFRRKRFQLLEKSTFWLSRTPDKPGSRDWDAAITRIASWVKLKDRLTGKTFFVINTHFDHRGRTARAKSASLIVKKLREKFGRYPVLLTGDFNTTPGSKPYQTLVGTGTPKGRRLYDAHKLSASKPQGPNSTWNGFRAVVPKRRIDFVFVTEDVKVLRHRILTDQRKGRFPSDHLPVVTRVEIHSAKQK